MLNSNAGEFGISETKLDNTAYDDCEVATESYNIVRSNRNRKGRGVACYIRNNICFNLKTCFSKLVLEILA